MTHQIPWVAKYWQPLFIFTALTFTLSTHFEPYPFSWLLKIIPILILLLFTTHKNQSTIPSVFVIGLSFSMLGDFILDYDRQAGFLYGLGAFFIAHLFYISSLGKWTFKIQSVLIAIVIITYGSIISYLIFPQLHDMQIPVIAYMSILFIMSVSAVFSRRSNYWIVLGGISFLFSDSIIGLNKFYDDVPLSHMLIMSSYYLAQYSLVHGFSQRTHE